YLTDNSTNGVELVKAGIRMRRGNSEPLQDGELIRIGDYEIQARIDFNVQAIDSQPFAGDSPNSFEALMGAVASQPAPTPMIAPQFQGASAMETLPDLFDFLSPTAVPPPTVADHVPSEQHDFRPPAPVAVPAPEKPLVQGSVIPEDWDLFSDAPAPVVNAAPAPAPILPPPPVVEPVALPVANAEPPPDLLQAFLRGAGLDQLRLDKADACAQMESIGRSYRLMVEGLIDVLRARASLKGEFRMQQTMIRPAENNPLKFAPNADEALLLLLRHGNQAFMAPDLAVRDSFDDLRAHQLAVMAGVEAAIKHLLTRFEPAQLEERMGKPGGLSSLFNGSRQAQYWQQFTELYSNISREAQDDFQDLFGREFSRAYEEHSARQRR
ncbi:type VI secretion system-associated FHA domain protein TagH, partial [Pseudomonas sp. BS-2016]